jgi:hypothetical protein
MLRRIVMRRSQSVSESIERNVFTSLLFQLGGYAPTCRALPTPGLRVRVSGDTRRGEPDTHVRAHLETYGLFYVADNLLMKPITAPVVRPRVAQKALGLSERRKGTRQ